MYKLKSILKDDIGSGLGVPVILFISLASKSHVINLPNLWTKYVYGSRALRSFAFWKFHFLRFTPAQSSIALNIL